MPSKMAAMIAAAAPSARAGGPAHRFRPGQLGDGRVQQLRQHLGRGRPARARHREIEFAAAGVAHLALLEARGRPAARRKAVERLLRRADPRAAALLGLAIRLAPAMPSAMHGQAARRHIGLGLVGARPAAVSLSRDRPRQIVDGAALHARRDFLGQKFEQEFGHGSQLARAACGTCAGEPGFAAALRRAVRTPGDMHGLAPR